MYVWAWTVLTYTFTFMYTGFVGTNFGEDTQAPFSVYNTIHVGSIGVASLLAFMPLKIYQITLCTFFIVFVCLHLAVKRLSKE